MVASEIGVAFLEMLVELDQWDGTAKITFNNQQDREIFFSQSDRYM